MNLEAEVMALRNENRRLKERNEFLEAQHRLDLSDAVRLRRQVDVLMESQGIKKEQEEMTLVKPSMDGRPKGEDT